VNLFYVRVVIVLYIIIMLLVLIIRRIEHYNENRKRKVAYKRYFSRRLIILDLDFVFTCELVVDAATPNWTAAGLEVLEENRRTRSAEDPLPFSRRRPVVPSTQRSVTIAIYAYILYQ
jgi:hypothetical protein